jgi:hypothetical protein
MSSWTKTRSVLANRLREDPGADVSALRAQMHRERLEARIHDLVVGGPPLTAEQRSRLAVMLLSPDTSP